MDMSHPQVNNGWGSPLTEIDPEDSVSNTTLVRAGTPPRVDGDLRKSSRLPPPSEPATAAVTESTKRKRPSLVFDGVVPPARKRKATSTVAPTVTSSSPAPPPAPSVAPSPAPPVAPPPEPEPVTTVNEEGAPASQQNSTTLEPTLLLAITKIEGLNNTVGEQNKRIEELVQDNAHLRDELINLSRTFQISKRDLQRVENTIPKLTTELKTKFEKMLEKTEGRIQGPIDRLLEELGRLRASPPTPVHVSSITTFPQNTQFVPESQAEGEGTWAPQEEYNAPGPSNKQLHYQENCEPHVQPPPQYNNYGRGGYRQFRGRWRGSRGGYSGNRHAPFYSRSYPPLPEGWQIVPVRAPPPSGPAAAPLEQASTAGSAPATAPAPAPVPPSASAPPSAPAPVPPTPTPGSGPITTPRRVDSCRSQGPPPPASSQQPQPHAYPRKYPQLRTPAPPHYDADPPPLPRHRPARLPPYDRNRDRDRDRECEREASPVREAYADRAPAPVRARSFSAPYRDEDRTAQPAPASPPPPRSRTQSFVEYGDQDDERPRARSEAPLDDTYRDDGARYVDDSPSAGYSPLRSDEPPQQQQSTQQQQPQQRWVASPSVSPSEHAVHHRHRRYHDGYRQQQRQRQRQNQQHQQNQQNQQRWAGRPERSSSRSRTGSRSTSESRGYVRRGGPGNDARGGGGRR